jgi:hypothetical protein
MADHRRAAIAPPERDDAAARRHDDALLITLMYGVAKKIDDGKVDRFTADPMFEALTYLADSVDTVLRYATNERARAESS